MNKDPKRYYAKLGVPPKASADEIKRAYRRRAMDLHPDRNTSPNATKEFQDINEAYAVLADASKRAQYDSLSVDIPEQESSTKQETPDPIVCSRCGKISAQPRYVVFYQIVSNVISTTRSGVQGIFCRACADKAALEASIITWLVGWWGFPWGPIYTAATILGNMFGGQQEKTINARLIAHQAWYFAFNGNVQLARAIAIEALEIAAKIKPSRKTAKQREKLGYASQDEKTSLLAKLGAFIGSLDDGTPIKRLKPQWGMFGRGFYQQAGILVVVITLIATWGLHTPPVPDSTVTTAPRSSRLPSRPNSVASVPAPAHEGLPFEHAFTEPPHPLPATGRYKRYWRGKPDVLAPLKLTTKAGASHHFIKIVDSQTRAPVLTAFLRAGETADLNVPLGNYRLLYASGETWYGTEHLFGPVTDYGAADETLLFNVEGNTIHGHNIELYERIGGNLKSKKITAADFQ